MSPTRSSLSPTRLSSYATLGTSCPPAGSCSGHATAEFGGVHTLFFSSSYYSPCAFSSTLFCPLDYSIFSFFYPLPSRTLIALSPRLYNLLSAYVRISSVFIYPPSGLCCTCVRRVQRQMSVNNDDVAPIASLRRSCSIAKATGNSPGHGIRRHPRSTIHEHQANVEDHSCPMYSRA